MTDPIALPPSSSRPASHRLSWLDVLSLTLVVGLAFIVASFAARNSDLWQHLATGRSIATGQFAFGTDPFAYTTEGAVWVDHSWLFDLALYQTYQSLGGPAVVAIKALGVALLAVLLLRFRREGASAGVVVTCVLLAIVAMSPRFLVQPVVVSLVLLASCLSLQPWTCFSLWSPMQA